MKLNFVQLHPVPSWSLKICRARPPFSRESFSRDLKGALSDIAKENIANRFSFKRFVRFWISAQSDSPVLTSPSDKRKIIPALSSSTASLNNFFLCWFYKFKKPEELFLSRGINWFLPLREFGRRIFGIFAKFHLSKDHLILTYFEHRSKKCECWSDQFQAVH